MKQTPRSNEQTANPSGEQTDSEALHEAWQSTFNHIDKQKDAPIDKPAEQMAQEDREALQRAWDSARNIYGHFVAFTAGWTAALAYARKK